MIIALHHTGIATRDLDRLSNFYMRLFSGEILHSFAWNRSDVALSARLGLKSSSGKLVMIGFPNARLELFEFSEPAIDSAPQLRSVAEPGLSHICFQVSDCHAEHLRLSDAGVEFHAPPLAMPGGGIFAYCRDPDGNVVEILQAPQSGHSASP